MKESVYKTYDDLPLFLNADMVANVLGISAASSYELMHEKDFPVLKIGNRMVVPKELQAAIDGRLGMFEDRMAKLLYKLTVEMDMGMSATLDCIQIDADYLRRLRANSVRNVKATNGLLTFEQKARAYDDYAEGDDQWHGRLSKALSSRAAAVVLADTPSTSAPAMAWSCCPPATWDIWPSVPAPTVSSVTRTT